MPVYEMSALPGGIQFQATVPGSCTPIDPKQPPQGAVANKQAMPPNHCEMILAKQLRGGGVDLSIKGSSLALLAGALQRYAGLPVIDHTGVSAQFDVHLTFDQTMPAADDANPPSGLPTIVGALQKAGLRLTRPKGDLDVMVIDRLERPSQN